MGALKGDSGKFLQMAAVFLTSSPLLGIGKPTENFLQSERSMGIWPHIPSNAGCEPQERPFVSDSTRIQKSS